MYKVISVAAAVALMTASVLSFAAPASAANRDDASTAIRVLKDRGLIRDSTARSDVTHGSGLSTGEGLTVEGPQDRVVNIRPAVNRAEGERSDVGALVYEGGAFDTVLTDDTIGYNAGYAVIRDSSAPNIYAYEISVDGQPAKLVATDGGAVLVEDLSGEVVNRIAAARARDAAGVSLPTYYSIRGDVLEQHVDLSTATYPVVADPRTECDLVWCTVVLSKTQTLTAAESLAGAGTLVCGSLVVAFVPVGVLCSAYAAAYFTAAVQAKNSGKCLASRSLRIGGSLHPVVEKC